MLRKRVNSVGRVTRVNRVSGGGAAAPVWTPAALTGLLSAVLPALSRSQGKLWQNLAKTVPVTAAADPCRDAVDPYTAVEWTAISDPYRPSLYAEGGGLYSLAFDGTVGLVAAVALTQPFVLAGRFYLSDVSAARRLFDSDSRALLGVDPSGLWVIAAGHPPLIGTVAATGWATVTATFDGASSSIRVNGAAVASGTTGGGGTGGNGYLGNDSGGNGLLGRCAGFVCVQGGLSGPDVTSLETFLTALA